MAAAIAPRERAHLLKHNPGFLTDDELISAFVARTAELRLLLDHLDANSDARVNQHMLLVGARGIGKSTLVRRFAAEIRRRPELRARWMPLVFGEESYAVTSLGELWLEALLHLADATGEARWREAHAALRAEQDDHRLAGLALARLLDFCDASGRRVVLVIENLGMLIDEQLDAGSAWQLRKVLQSEPRVALVATAVARFDGIEHSDEPLFDLFAVHDLGPLDLDEIAALWRTVTDQELRGQQARPLQILTGGNPRLLAMLGGFAKGRSLRRLMDDLTSLIDEHTSYFKANIEVLPAQERKVFSALADLWRPSTAAEVAEHARLTSTKASAWLVRLTQRGVVTALGDGKRDRRYQITERLYNIYHLMRRRSGPEARVTAVVDFLVHLYEPPELMERMWRIADDAEEQLDPDHLAVLDRVTGRVDAECAAMIALSVPATLVERLPEVARIRQLARDELQDQGDDDPEVMVARLGLATLDGEIGALEALVPRAEAILERASPSAAPTPTLELLHMAVAMVSLLPPPVIVQLTADVLALTRRFGWSFWGRLVEVLRALNDAMDRSLRAGRRPPDPAIERHARELRQMADHCPDNGLLQLLAASVGLWVDGSDEAHARLERAAAGAGGAFGDLATAARTGDLTPIHRWAPALRPWLSALPGGPARELLIARLDTDAARRVEALRVATSEAPEAPGIWLALVHELSEANEGRAALTAAVDALERVSEPQIVLDALESLFEWDDVPWLAAELSRPDRRPTPGLRAAAALVAWYADAPDRAADAATLVEQHPELRTPWFIAVELALASHGPAQALALAQRAIERHGHDEALIFELLLALAGADDAGCARRCVDLGLRLLDAAPGHRHARYHLAAAHLRLGEPDEALRWTREGLAGPWCRRLAAGWGTTLVALAADHPTSALRGLVHDAGRQAELAVALAALDLLDGASPVAPAEVIEVAMDLRDMALQRRPELARR